MQFDKEREDNLCTHKHVSYRKNQGYEDELFILFN